MNSPITVLMAGVMGIGFHIICGFISMSIARKKLKEPFPFFLVGLFFGLPGVLVTFYYLTFKDFSSLSLHGAQSVRLNPEQYFRLTLLVSVLFLTLVALINLALIVIFANLLVSKPSYMALFLFLEAVVVIVMLFFFFRWSRQQYGKQAIKKAIASQFFLCFAIAFGSLAMFLILFGVYYIGALIGGGMK